MSKSVSRVLIVLVAAPLFVLGACAGRSKPAPGTSGQPVSAASSSSSSSSSAAPQTNNVLDVIAVEAAPDSFSFDTAGVSNLPAGPVNSSFRNAAPSNAHELRIIRIRDGNFHAYENAVVSQGLAASAGLGDEILNTQPVAPGKTVTQTLTLAPGVYALASFAPASNGKVDAQLGMLRELDITPV